MVRLWVVRVAAQPSARTSFVVGTITTVRGRVGLRVIPSFSSMPVLPRSHTPMTALRSCTTVLRHVSLRLSSATRDRENDNKPGFVVAAEFLREVLSKQKMREIMFVSCG